MLGLKHAFETGQIASRQYIDLVPQAYPTESPAHDNLPTQQVSDTAPLPAQSLLDRHMEPAESREVPTAGPATGSQSGEGIFNDEDSPQNMNDEGSNQGVIDKSPADSSSYGPMRRRVHGKNGPQAYFRPTPMRTEDFSEMMDEIMPRLMERVIQNDTGGPAEPMAVPPITSPRSSGSKRSHSPDAQEGQGPLQVPRTETSAASPGDSQVSSVALACPVPSS